MINYNSDEINEVLRFLKSHLSLSDGKYVKIKSKDIESYDGVEDYDDFHSLLLPLIGYKVRMKQIGNHRNDSQIVDYEFTFKSPDDEITEIKTSMSLMIGWDFDENVIIK